MWFYLFYSRDSTPQVRRLTPTLAHLTRSQGISAQIYSVAFNADGTILYAGNQLATLVVWRLSDKKVIKEIKVNSSDCRTMIIK